MKVLQINSFFTVGGPPRIMNGIYDTLKENGFECKIAAAREKMYVPKDSYQIGKSIGVKINALKARIFDNEGFNAKKATRELVEYIKGYNPDIIHLHNLHGYCINIEILFDFIKRTNIPVVWTLHDCWTMTGHCAHFVHIGCDKWETRCSVCPQIREYPASLFADRSTKNYLLKKRAYCGIENMTIVTPSKWLASYVPHSILGENPVEVIHNGIDLCVFSPRKSDVLERNGLANKKIVLGVAQNWAEKKGFEDFIELSKRLSDEYRIVMIGLTDEQKKAIPSNILGLTRTADVNELVEWYSAATVFVNFTYQDTFPTVNIEALACGTPVMTYDTGGSPEAVDETCGWVIKQGDIGSAQKIIEGIGDKSEYTDKCLARSKAFDRKAKYQEYIDLYKEILEK